MSDEFTWCDNPDVVIPTQPAIAVFENTNGAVCIRQEGQFGTDEDAWVFFSKDRALTVARAILDVAGIEPVDAFPEIWTTAMHNIGNSAGPSQDRKDHTAAERQRRYRERHADRNAVTRDTVTGDAVTPFRLAAE
jgi:hypothetical protein